MNFQTPFLREIFYIFCSCFACFIVFVLQALGHGFSRVKFGQPDLFLCCNIEENVANRSCQSSTPMFDREANSDVWEIPCGIKEHAGIVSVVTFAVAGIAALLLVSTSVTYSICDKL